MWESNGLSNVLSSEGKNIALKKPKTKPKQKREKKNIQKGDIFWPIWNDSLVFCRCYYWNLYVLALFTLSNILEQICCINLAFRFLVSASRYRSYNLLFFNVVVVRPPLSLIGLCYYLVWSTSTWCWSSNMGTTAGNALVSVFPILPPCTTWPFHLLKCGYQMYDIHDYFVIQQKFRTDYSKNVLER